MNDQEAIQLALKGIEDGYRAIFANHSACLFTHALRFLKNRETAEDVVQETFNDAFRFLQSFKGKSSLRTWLYKILYRKAIRSSKNQNPFLLSEPGKIDATFDRIEASLDTAEILDRLSERERSLLIMAYWDQMKIEEIAGILEISPGNAKVSLFRARQSFAKIWQSQKGEIANEV